MPSRVNSRQVFVSSSLARRDPYMKDAFLSVNTGSEHAIPVEERDCFTP